jgi:hypothetical protein
MNIPAEVAKLKTAAAGEVKTLEGDAATYEKSLVAFVAANKGKVIAIVALVFVPTFLIAFEMGKHIRF